MIAGLPYWRLSLFYFAYFAFIGGLIPYWGLYLNELQFDGYHTGILMACLTGTRLVAPSIWGYLADRTGRRMLIIRAGGIAALVFFAGLLVRSDFYWMVAVTLLFSFFWNAILSQFEAETLSHLEDRTSHYSRIRLWGSIGFIVVVIGAGYLYDRVSATWLPVVLLPVMLLIALSTFLVPQKLIRSDSVVSETFLNLLRAPRSLLFLGVCFLMHASHAPYYTFFSLYMEMHGHSRAVAGWLWALGAIAEIVLFLGMHQILPRLGVHRLALLALVLTTLRWYLIACHAGNFQLLLFAQVLHAFSFGAFHAAAIEWVHRYYGAAHAGKGQAIYNSVSFGLGSALGAMLAGWTWDNIGAVTMYALACYACALATLLWWLAPKLGRRSRGQASSAG